MSSSMTRRGALTALAALAGAAIAHDAAVASPGLRISRIHVDVSQLRARRGEQAARWVAEAMPGSAARALGARFASGAPGGAVLNVHVEDVHLPPMRSGSGLRIIDEITGFVALS